MDSFFDRVVSYVRYRWNQRVRLRAEEHASLIGLLSLLRPMRAQGVTKIRIGSDRDGGYVMLDDFQKIDAALSLGVGPEISWDFVIAERGIPVWQFDHTVDVLPQTHPLFHFERKRIVSQGSSENDVALASLLEKFAGKELLVKMDIEGDEWEVLARLETGLLTNCRQIVIELHDFLKIGNAAWRESARQALIVLANDFGVVHVHANNLSKHILSGGLTLPDSLEVTFANRHFYHLETTDETFPSPIDRKNNPYFPDIRLGRFQFHPDGKT